MAVLSFADACELLNGKTPYEVKQAVGKGAYATVFAAVDTANKEDVAIKILHTHILRDFFDATRVLREVSLMRHFNHDNICPIRDLFWVPQAPHIDPSVKCRLCIVMPLMPTDLKRVVQTMRQEITEHHIRWWTYQALLALAAIHRAKVIHRDFTPANVLVSLRCDLRLCDFGLARARPKSSKRAGPMTEYVVTRWYRAPELLLGHRHYNGLVDVWSLGCLCVELFARSTLLKGSGTIAQVELILDLIEPGDEPPGYPTSIPTARAFVADRRGGPRPPLSMLMPGASPVMVDLVSKMLAFYPQNRISVLDALKHPALEEYYLESDMKAIEAVQPFNFDESKVRKLEDVEKGLCEQVEGVARDRAAARPHPVVRRAASSGLHVDERTSRLGGGSSRAAAAEADAEAAAAAVGSGGAGGTGEFDSVRKTVSFRAGEADVGTAAEAPAGGRMDVDPDGSEADSEDIDDGLDGSGEPSTGYTSRLWDQLAKEESKRGVHPRAPTQVVSEALASGNVDISKLLYQAIETTNASLVLRVSKHPSFATLTEDPATLVPALRRAAYLCCGDLVRVIALASPKTVAMDCSPRFATTEVMLPNGVTASTRGTAVHTAAAKCSVGALHVLVALGADLNVLNHQGMTPLHQAALGGAQWSVIYLLAAGARTDIPDKDGGTAADVLMRSKSDALRLAYARHVTKRNMLSS